jgi:hypothetical protein
MYARVPVLVTLAVALVAPALSAQVTIVDEGSFTVSRRGTRVGREEFSIRASPNTSGVPVIVAQASAVYEDLRLFPALSTRADGVANSYTLEIRRGAEVEERWTGNVGAGRVSARIARAGIDAVREFLVTDGALLLDDDVFHQFYFVARRRPAATVAVIVPRRNQQVVLRLTDRGTQTIDIAGQPIAASTFSAVSPDGVERQVWVDSEGRVLRVAIPSLGLVAQRDDPPRPLVPR